MIHLALWESPCPETAWLEHMSDTDHLGPRAGTRHRPTTGGTGTAPRSAR